MSKNIKIRSVKYWQRPQINWFVSYSYDLESEWLDDEKYFLKCHLYVQLQAVLAVSNWQQSILKYIKVYD